MTSAGDFKQAHEEDSLDKWWVQVERLTSAISHLLDLMAFTRFTLVCKCMKTKIHNYSFAPPKKKKDLALQLPPQRLPLKYSSVLANHQKQGSGLLLLLVTLTLWKMRTYDVSVIKMCCI